MSPTISLIIPVYNASEYLEECLSFLNSSSEEDLSQIEVICVNDGSTDDSLKKLNEAKEQHDNIVVIDQPNGGVSVARNSGLKEANGNYVYFMDADDYLTDGAINKLINWTISDKDIYRFSVLALVHGDVSMFYNSPTTELLNEFLNSPMPTGLASAYLLKKSLIEQLKLSFLVGVKYFEDMSFMAKYISHITSAKSISDVIYVYRQDNPSATRRTMTLSGIEDNLTVLEDLITYYNDTVVRNRPILSTSIISLWKLCFSFLAFNQFEERVSFKQFKQKYKAFYYRSGQQVLKKINTSVINKTAFLPAISPLFYNYYRLRFKFRFKIS